MKNNAITYHLAFVRAKSLKPAQKLNLLKNTFEAVGGDIIRLIDEWSQLTLTAEEQVFLAEAQELSKSLATEALKYQDAGIISIPITSSDYPTKLREYLGNNRPVMLWAKGNMALLEKSAIAIVGSRDSTPEGEAWAISKAHEAVYLSEVVVSGAAKGIDAIAMEAALKQGGQVIAVLAEGLGKPPKGFKDHYAYYQAGQLLYISQFDPAETWQSFRAMERNKVVYGLSNKVFVADAQPTGGTYEGVKAAADRLKSVALVNNFILARAGIEAEKVFQELGVAFDGEVVNPAPIPELEKTPTVATPSTTSKTRKKADRASETIVASDQLSPKVLSRLELLESVNQGLKAKSIATADIIQLLSDDQLAQLIANAMKNRPKAPSKKKKTDAGFLF